MDYKAETERVKREADASIRDSAERAYEAFENRREQIFAHIHALGSSNSEAATPEQIFTAIDEMLTVVIAMASTAQDIPAMKEVLESKGFFGTAPPEFVVTEQSTKLH